MCLALEEKYNPKIVLLTIAKQLRTARLLEEMAEHLNPEEEGLLQVNFPHIHVFI